jgi:hypothetical protein
MFEMAQCNDDESFLNCYCSPNVQYRRELSHTTTVANYSVELSCGTSESAPCWVTVPWQKLLQQNCTKKLKCAIKLLWFLLSDQKPDVMYADIGGMDIQKQEVREAVELPLTHFELYKQVCVCVSLSVFLVHLLY